MISKPTACTLWGALIIAAIIALNSNVAWASAEPVATKVDETELQSSVMSFADRMSAILLTAFARYDKNKPSAKNRNEVLSIVVYSLWNAYIIASESDPDIALLDMVSMVTLGRIVFEEQGIKTFGEIAKPIARGFRMAEKDIRSIAVLTLDPAQMDRLMALILRWRQTNPEVTYFPFVRFSSFSADRRESKLERSEAPDGLIDSVEAATQQAEEMRLLAERGMYLGTRMPQLASLFAELWAAKLADDVTTERREAIAQLADAVQAERQAIIGDFMAHEKRIIKDTLQQVTQTTEALVERTLQQMTQTAEALSERTLQQMTQTTEALAERTLQQMTQTTEALAERTLQQMTQTAEALVERTLRQITILVALFLVGLTLANLLVGYILRGKSRDHQPVA